MVPAKDQWGNVRIVHIPVVPPPGISGTLQRRDCPQITRWSAWGNGTAISNPARVEQDYPSATWPVQLRPFINYKWLKMGVIRSINGVITDLSLVFRAIIVGNDSFPSWWSKTWVCFVGDLWLFSQSEIHHDWGISVGKSWVGRRFCLPPRTVSEPKQWSMLVFFFFIN